MTDNNNDTSAPVSPDDERPDAGVKKLSQVPTIIACVAGACILGLIFFEQFKLCANFTNMRY